MYESWRLLKGPFKGSSFNGVQMVSTDASMLSTEPLDMVKEYVLWPPCSLCLAFSSECKKMWSRWLENILTSLEMGCHATRSLDLLLSSDLECFMVNISFLLCKAILDSISKMGNRMQSFPHSVPINAKYFLSVGSSLYAFMNLLRKYAGSVTRRATHLTPFQNFKIKERSRRPSPGF